MVSLSSKNRFGSKTARASYPPPPKIHTKSGRLLFAPASGYIQINRDLSTPRAKKDTASIAVKNRAAAISPTFILYFLSVLLTFLTDKLPFPV